MHWISHKHEFKPVISTTNCFWIWFSVASVRTKKISYTAQYLSQTKQMHIGVCVSECGVSIPLADSFLVLMIFAAYSCPDDFFTHLRTTEKAPLRRKNINNQKSVPFQTLPLWHTCTHTQSVTFEAASTCGSGLLWILTISPFPPLLCPSLCLRLSFFYFTAIIYYITITGAVNLKRWDNQANQQS